MKKKDISMNYKEKVLLHLKDYSHLSEDKDYPEAVTQKGISDRLSMSRTHTSRITKDLVKEDLVVERSSHVKGKGRKLKTYHLNERGLKKAENISSQLKDQKVKVLLKDHEQEMKLDNVIDKIEDKLNEKLDILDFIERIDKHKVGSRPDEIILDFHDLEEKETIKLIDETPEFEKLYGREDKLKELKGWIEGKIPFAILSGQKGHGASVLASKFVHELEDYHVLWVNVNDKNINSIKEKILDFKDEIGLEEDLSSDRKAKEDKGKERGLELLAELVQETNRDDLLLVFDDYYDVEDRLVDVLNDTVSIIETSAGANILITTREGIPMYERFFRDEHIEKDIIKEIEISPLNKVETQKLLGGTIEDEALDRIMLMTNGNPLFLKLLKEEKKEELFQISPLSKQQISLLIFLKSKTV